MSDHAFVSHPWARGRDGIPLFSGVTLRSNKPWHLEAKAGMERVVKRAGRLAQSAIESAAWLLVGLVALLQILS